MEAGLQNKIENIQVLRFIAAFSVMMVHLPVFEFGAWGVDIFFVISGFIMMYITEYNNKNFLIKRIIRIVPLYWLLTLAVFLIAFLKPEILNNTTANFEHLLKSLFFIPFNKNEAGHFPILFLGWTLNYEIIFYILFAFTIVVFKRFRLMISSFLILLFFGINYFFSELTFINSAYSNTIMFEFIYGMIIFLIWKRFKNNSPPSNFNKTVVTLLLICIIIFFSSLEVSRIIKWGMPSAFLVLYFLITLGNFKFPKMLVNLGDASYSLYLIHPYIIQFFYKIIKVDNYNINIQYLYTSIIILLIFLFSTLIFNFIEKPLNDKFKKLLNI